MHYQTVINCFNQAFAASHNTRLFAGAAEPLYLPATHERGAQLWFREDYAASALHEAAHWCIAGWRRRQLIDFGYEYTPPPRNAAQQAAFFRLELKVQALESLFADQAGVRFEVSADNLTADCRLFRQQVHALRPQVEAWMASSRDQRAQRLHHRLAGLTADTSGG